MATLRQLEYLVAVADEQNFRRASKLVNTTQPTLSSQLQALEARLGARLVERTRKRVLLTPVGAQVVAIARRMLQDAKRIQAVTQADQDRPNGSIKLGLSSSVAPYLMPWVTAEILSAFPRLKMHVHEDDAYSLMQGLKDDFYDAIIVSQNVQLPGFCYVPLFAEPIYLTVALSHPLANRGQVQADGLKGKHIRSPRPRHAMHDAALLLCGECRETLRFDFEGTGLEELREMVATGLGIALIPGLYIRSMLLGDSAVRTLELQGRSVYRMVGMIWKQSSGRQDVFERMAQILKARIEDQFPDFPKAA
ncbi:MAG: LysR family transcriptional regulator [Rhodomicrobium sp.]|nr:LysR family transcriptional regulator [Rhodomicrobium sp.]